MKSFITAAALLLAVSGFAQTDTIPTKKPDTIRVGNFIIIKKNKYDGDTTNPVRGHVSVDIDVNGEYYSSKHKSNITTNWLIFDIGFCNMKDKTAYGSPEANEYLHADGGEPFTSNDLDLNSGKSSSVGIWLFMQKLNLSKHVINLKYGLGIEMFNYRYETNITYHRNPAYIFRDSIDFSKNKLATDYVTIPFMLNITPFPNKEQGLSFSFGVSAGYLYNSRNKQVSDERGKQKIKGNIGIAPWRLAYIAEIGLGPVRVYGSYSFNNLYDQGMKQYPYAVGLRFSNW